MSLDFLEWDSELFGIKIGKILHFTSFEEFEQIISYARENQYKLIYCFADPSNVAANEVYSAFGKLVDRKVTYYRNIEQKDYSLPLNVVEYTEGTVTEELYALALQSGAYSRFKIDTNFPHGSFEKLYRKWIENSVNKTFAEKIYVYKADHSIKGILILKRKENIGTISLIGVDQSVRGKGIGLALIEAALHYYSICEVSRIEAVTQMENHIACKFYEKNNFRIQSIENIYHIWLNKI